MARAKTVELPEPAAPKIRKCCGTCAGWRANNLMPTIGQCMPSARSRQSPLETLDLACCSAYEPRP